MLDKRVLMLPMNVVWQSSGCCRRNEGLKVRKSESFWMSGWIDFHVRSLQFWREKKYKVTREWQV